MGWCCVRARVGVGPPIKVHTLFKQEKQGSHSIRKYSAKDFEDMVELEAAKFYGELSDKDASEQCAAAKESINDIASEKRTVALKRARTASKEGLEKRKQKRSIKFTE